jgi:beta-N-acetylhexosaminidase
MNMGGISKEPNAALKAVQAGCDIVLMPLNVEQAHQEILALYQSDETFRAQVDASVKRIIRMKFCLNLLQITDLLPAMEEKIMKIERK